MLQVRVPGIKGRVPSHPVLQPHVCLPSGSQGFHPANLPRYFMCTSECDHAFRFLSWQPREQLQKQQKIFPATQSPGNGPGACLSEI